jgi:exodeoxyribonuclease VII large subunit
LAVRIANFPIPVLIGIGHEIDQSVLDLVAYQSLKTPTAVADYVVERNAGFESQLDVLAQQLRDEIGYRIRQENERITALVHELNMACKSRIMVELQKLDHARYRIQQAGKYRLQTQHTRIEHLETLLQAIHPDKVLARGYTITSLSGKNITSASALEKGMSIQTTFQDGSVKSIIE